MMLVWIALATCALASGPPVISKQQALDNIAKLRKKELDAMNNMHSSMKGTAWKYASVSAGANMIPEVGAVTGIVADIILTLKWNQECQSQYDSCYVDLDADEGALLIFEFVKGFIRAGIRDWKHYYAELRGDYARAVARAIASNHPSFSGTLAERQAKAQVWWREQAQKQVDGIIADAAKQTAEDSAYKAAKKTGTTTVSNGANEIIHDFLAKGRQEFVTDVQQNGVNRIMRGLGSDLTRVSKRQFVQASQAGLKDLAEHLVSAAPHAGEEAVAGAVRTAIREDATRRAAQATEMLTRDYAAKAVTEYGGEETAKSMIECIPFLGSVIGGGMALVFMRCMTGNENDKFYDAHCKQTNERYDAMVKQVNDASNVYKPTTPADMTKVESDILDYLRN